MEAARLPMLYFDPKISTEKAEFTTVLLSLIPEHFDEDASGYSKECQELDNLREAACNAPFDYTGCATLKRYYCQLCFLLNRFPFLVGQQVPGLSFTWEESYSEKSSTHNEVEFEKAAILYNVAAIHSFLGSSDNRSTAEGMKISCTHLQNAAWAFQRVRDDFNSTYAPDWTYEILSFQEQLMLAQAQECILEKSMADNRKSNITAKVAVQCADFYKKSLDHLNNSKASSVFGSSKFKKWKKHIEMKVAFTRCVTYYYQTLFSEDQSNYGERLAYAQAASEKLAECVQLSQGMGEDVKTSIQFINDVVSGKYIAAKKENDFVYHAKVPPFDTLPDIKGAVLVKGVGFDISDKTVSGADIFSKLVPMEAHEASSLYSEEKAKLLREVGGRIEDEDETLAQYLASLQIDPDKLLPEFDMIPDSLVAKCAAISVRPETMKELTAAMNELAAVSTSTLAEIDQTERILQAETDEETEFQSKYGKRRTEGRFDDISTELEKCKQAFTKASQSNSELHKAMDLHIQNLNLLASPLDQIKAALPNPQSALAAEEMAIVSRIKQLFSKIGEVRTQRASLYSKLREQVLADDITKNIVTSGPDGTQALFAEQLKKHDSLIEQINMYLNAQPKILDALTKANVEFVPIRQKIDLTLHQRQARIEALVYSYDVYQDLLEKQQKGMEFYQKLQHNVHRLLEKAQGAREAQVKEREGLVEKLKPKGPPPPRPTASKPGTAGSPANASGKPKPGSGPPRLMDYLPYMKDGGNAALAISSVNSDDLDLDDEFDDLDDVNLPDISVSDTPKLKDFLPFMNKGRNSNTQGEKPLPPELSSLPPEALKYLPQNMSSLSATHPPPINMGGPHQHGNNSSQPLTNQLQAAQGMRMQRPPVSTGSPGGPGLNQPRPGFGTTPLSHIQTHPAGQLGAPGQPPGHLGPRGQALPSGQAGDTSLHKLRFPHQGVMLNQPRQVVPGNPPVEPSMQNQSIAYGMQQPPASQISHGRQQPPVPQLSQLPQQPPVSPMPYGMQQPPASQMSHGMQQPPASQMSPGMQQPPASQMSHGMHQPPTSLMSHGMRQPPAPHMSHGMQQPPASQMSHGAQQPPVLQLSHGMQQPPAPHMSHGVQQPPAPHMSHGMQQPSTSQMSHGTQQSPVSQLSHGMQQPPAPLMSHGMQQPHASQMSHGMQQPPVSQLSLPMQQPPASQMSHGMHQLPTSQMSHGMQQPPALQLSHGMQQPPASQMSQPTQQPPASQISKGLQLPPASQKLHGMQQPPTSQILHGMPQQPVSQLSQGMQLPPVAQIPHGIQRPPLTQLSQGIQQPPVSQMSQGMQRPPVSQIPQGIQQPPVSPMSQGMQRPPVSQMSQGIQRPPVSQMSQGMQRPPVSQIPQGIQQSLVSQMSQGMQRPLVSQIPPGMHLPSQAPATTSPIFSHVSYNLPGQHSMTQTPQNASSPHPMDSRATFSSSSLNQASGTRMPSSHMPQQQPHSQSIAQTNLTTASHYTPGTSQQVHQPATSRPGFPGHQIPPASAQSLTTMPGPTRNSHYVSAGPGSQYRAPNTTNPALDLLSDSGTQRVGVAPLQPSNTPGQPSAAPSGGQQSSQLHPPSSSPTVQVGSSAQQGMPLQHKSLQQPQHSQQQVPQSQQQPQMSQPQVQQQPGQLRPTNQIWSHPQQGQSPRQPPPTNHPQGSDAHQPQPQQHSVQTTNGGPSKDGVKPWTSAQPAGPAGSNPHTIPVLAVSPQPKSKSNVDELAGVSVAPHVPGLDSSFESKIDWSLATAKPSPSSKTETLLWSAPASKQSTSKDKGGTPAPPLIRHHSRDHREPYSDESSLQQFVSEVERYVKQLDTLTKPSLKGPTPLDKEWQDMAEEQERESKRNSTAAGLSEPTRNRYQDVLPYDKYRVTLSDQKNDYINASLLENLFEGSPKFIVTQGPLNQTEADFWNMIIEQKVEHIVMLSRWTEQDHSESARYWPRDRNDRLSFGNLLITLQLTNNHKFWVERRMNMTNLVTKETHVCTQLQFTSWPSNQLPPPMPLLTLVNEVTALYKKQRNPNIPIVVHCGNGISKTGVFCALYHGVQSVNSGQGIVSLGHAVGLLRQRRKGMVSTQEEYLFCHTALLYYAQDILVKRGILTSQASFSKPLASSSNRSHGRTPSNDFIMSDTSLASLDQLSSLALTSGKTSLSTTTAPATAATMNATDPPLKVDVPQTVAKNVDQKSDHSTQASYQTDLLPANDNAASAQVTNEQTAHGITQQENGKSDKPVELMGGLLDLSNPQTFDIGQGRQRITKADFLNPNSGIKSSKATADDPFSSLDPMWSLTNK